MPAVNSVNNNLTPKLLRNNQEGRKDNTYYLFSSNPVVDALVWGGAGAAAGAGYGLYAQKKLLKDKTRVENAINGITQQIEACKKNNKSVKGLEYSLKCLKNNRINLNSVRNWAVAIGIITLIPQLICNTLMWAGKKGYDRITEGDRGKTPCG